jgi:hypothetical protein
MAVATLVPCIEFYKSGKERFTLLSALRNLQKGQSRNRFAQDTHLDADAIKDIEEGERLTDDNVEAYLSGFKDEKLQRYAYSVIKPRPTFLKFLSELTDHFDTEVQKHGEHICVITMSPVTSFTTFRTFIKSSKIAEVGIFLEDSDSLVSENVKVLQEAVDLIKHHSSSGILVGLDSLLKYTFALILELQAAGVRVDYGTSYYENRHLKDNTYHRVNLISLTPSSEHIVQITMPYRMNIFGQDYKFAKAYQIGLDL